MIMVDFADDLNFFIVMIMNTVNELLIRVHVQNSSYPDVC